MNDAFLSWILYISKTTLINECYIIGKMGGTITITFMTNYVAYIRCPTTNIIIIMQNLIIAWTKTIHLGYTHYN